MKGGPGNAAKHPAVPSGPSDRSSWQSTARILIRIMDGPEFNALKLDPNCWYQNEQPDRSLGTAVKHGHLPFRERPRENSRSKSPPHSPSNQIPVTHTVPSKIADHHISSNPCAFSLFSSNCTLLDLLRGKRKKLQIVRYYPSLLSSSKVRLDITHCEAKP